MSSSVFNSVLRKKIVVYIDINIDFEKCQHAFACVYVYIYIYICVCMYDMLY